MLREMLTVAGRKEELRRLKTNRYGAEYYSHDIFDVNRRDNLQILFVGMPIRKWRDSSIACFSIAGEIDSIAVLMY